ncbi:MAG: hypothetical protein ACR2PT_05825 [Endozoicomonas sp.]
MTSTQYIMGWAVYLSAATGCLLALWLITGRLGPRFRRVLRLTAAVLLYVPWWTSPDLDLLSPALLTMLFDGLSDGLEGMSRAGLIVVISSGAAAILAICLPVRAEPKASKDDKRKAKPSGKPKVRQEPSVGQP